VVTQSRCDGPSASDKLEPTMAVPPWLWARSSFGDFFRCYIVPRCDVLHVCISMGNVLQRSFATDAAENCTNVVHVVA
jgi:hypothetical protein